MTKYLWAAGGIFITALFAIIAWIFMNPQSETVCVLERFQTFIGGALATIAAVITAAVVYVSATEPIRERRRLETEKSASRKKAAAALAYAALSNMKSQINRADVSLIGEPPKLPDVIAVPRAIDSIDFLTALDMPHSGGMAAVLASLGTYNETVLLLRNYRFGSDEVEMVKVTLERLRKFVDLVDRKIKSDILQIQLDVPEPEPEVKGGSAP